MNIAASAPSNPRSLTSLAYERLRDDILRGRLAPSERLRIQALSERYQIGATAIREALSRLTTDGLVDAEDQRGFTVAPVSREELLDLTQTRIEIEQTALRMAVANGDVEWESHLLSSFHRLSRAEAQPWTGETLAAWAWRIASSTTPWSWAADRRGRCACAGFCTTRPSATATCRCNRPRSASATSARSTGS